MRTATTLGLGVALACTSGQFVATTVRAESQDSSSLATADLDSVMSLLDEWGLRRFFEDCFAEQAVDGEALVYSQPEFFQDACPQVPMLQWDRLWRRLAPLQQVSKTSPPKGVDTSLDSEAPSGGRRLADSGRFDGYSGVSIAQNSSAVFFAADRAIYRHDDGLAVWTPNFKVEGDVHWEGSSPLDANITALEWRIRQLEAQLNTTESDINELQDVTLSRQCELLFQGRVCMSATTALHDESFFYSSYHGHVHGAFLVYDSGYVDCNVNGVGTHWGCEGDTSAMGVWLVDAESDSYVYPAEGTYTVHSANTWYEPDDSLGWWANAGYV